MTFSVRSAKLVSHETFLFLFTPIGLILTSKCHICFSLDSSENEEIWSPFPWAIAKTNKHYFHSKHFQDYLLISLSCLAHGNQILQMFYIIYFKLKHTLCSPFLLKIQSASIHHMFFPNALSFGNWGYILEGWL